MINFLLGVSWTGISFFNTITSPLLLVLLSLVVGIVFVLMFFMVIRQLKKLAEDNSFHMAETLNKTAEVYTPIPEKKTGKGKILISVRGSVHELEAMTLGERIPSGKVVKVINIENNDILIVELI
jgi:membrane protein implicated in regulation of membrane protease activity